MKRIYGILSVLFIWIFVFGSFVSGADETLVDTLVPETLLTSTPEETKNELPSLEKVGVAALYDVESMTRIYDKNSEVKTAPALTAKMMVALVVIEELEGRLDEMVKVPSSIASIQKGSHMELVGNESISVYDLLAGLIMNNANDAAYALAHHVSGSEAAFVELMNQKAIELEMADTCYVSVMDANEDGAYTTAEDVVKLAARLIKDSVYKEISSKTIYTIPKTNKKGERKLYTRNHLLSKQIYPNYYMAEATGLCAGSSQKSGYCAVSTAILEDREYLCVIMAAEGSAAEGFYNLYGAKELLKWGSNKYAYRVLLDSSKIMGEIKVRLSEEYDWVGVIPKGEIRYFMPKALVAEDVVVYESNIFYDVLTAPVADGEVVGEVKVYCEGVLVGILPLVTRRGLGQSRTESFATWLGQILTSKPVIIVVSAVCTVLVLGILGKSVWLYRKKIRIQIDYEKQ